MALGPLAWLHTVSSSTTQNLVVAVDSVFMRLGAMLPFASEHPTVVNVFAVTLALMAPGLVVLALVHFAASSQATFRYGVVGGLLVLGVAGFFVLPMVNAIVLVVVVGGTALLVASPLHRLVRTGSVVLAVVLTVDTARTALTDGFTAASASTQAYAALSGVDAPEFWALVAVVVAAVPFAAAVVRLMRGWDASGSVPPYRP